MVGQGKALDLWNVFLLLFNLKFFYLKIQFENVKKGKNNGKGDGGLSIVIFTPLLPFLFLPMFSYGFQ
jgi:hypothetical protein